MIKTLTVTNYVGDSIKMELARPEKSGFAVRAMTGITPGKATISTSEMSTTDGALFTSGRIPQRALAIDILFVSNVLGESIEQLRLKAYRLFPLRQKIELIIETENRTVSITGYVESNESFIFSKDVNCLVSIICPDPFFYSTGYKGVSAILLSRVDPMFEFPFTNDSLTEKLLVFGQMRENGEKIIFYDGDSETGITMTVKFNGPAKNVIVYNANTLEVMRISSEALFKLTGKESMAGDEITITTVRGNKSAVLLRNGTYTNVLNSLDRNTDWIHLVKGTNVFAYSAETGDKNVEILIQYRTLYDGV